MAGILANSVSSTMVSGDTSADNSVSGYLTAEKITLTVSPSGSSYAWAMARPTTSTARADLSAESGASVSFVPDSTGYFTITCTVSGTTTYVLRVSVAEIGTVSSLSIARLQPVTDSQVPTPPTGASLFYSSTQSALAIKLANGSVFTIDTTAV